MLEDKTRWNKKHQDKNLPKDAIRALVNHIHLAPIDSKCLDIACGKGRHTHYLASKGFVTDAVDYSDVALESLDENHLINVIEADLDHYMIEKESYDVIVCSNFLSRRLFPFIKAGLKEGGLLVFETFVEHEHAFSHMPSNKEYLLKPNELLHTFIGLQVLFYEEKETKNSCNEVVKIATLVAKKA